MPGPRVALSVDVKSLAKSGPQTKVKFAFGISLPEKEKRGSPNGASLGLLLAPPDLAKRNCILQPIFLCAVMSSGVWDYAGTPSQAGIYGATTRDRLDSLT